MTPRKQGRGDETVQLVRRGADDEVDEGAALMQIGKQPALRTNNGISR